MPASTGPRPDRICHAHRPRRATAAFDAGHIRSDRGVLLLAGADQRLGPIDSRAAVIHDHRDAKPLNLKRLPDRVFTRSSQQDGRPGRYVIYP